MPVPPLDWPPTPTTKEFDYPSPIIFERGASSTYPKDADGNLICPAISDCPKCKGNEVCQQRGSSPTSCAENYCAPPADDGNSKSTPIGGIVGGVIGGVVVLALLAALYYYKFYYSKNPPALDDVMMDGLGPEADDISDYAVSKLDSVNENPKLSPNKETFSSDGTLVERPQARRLNSNNAAKSKKRLSSYESFTKPSKVKTAASVAAAQRRARQRQIVNQANAANSINSSGNHGNIYADPRSTHRNSVATSIASTNASNILPIAYIPGVTVRPTINNTRSIYSYDEDSVFSDLNTIENASIVGDVSKNNSPRADTSANNEEEVANETMTAIKAQPRLVNVARIEEEAEDEDDDDDEDDDITDEEDYSADYDDNEAPFKNDSLIGGQKTLSNNTSNNNLNTTTLSNMHSVDDESDSDVDSDIGEITRATSVRKKPSQISQESTLTPDREVLLDINSATNIPVAYQNTSAQGESYTDFQQPRAFNRNYSNNNNLDSGSSIAGAGSFVFDLELDGPPKSHHSDSSGERSPFEDPIG
ncbi:uncharacterized protein RJT20DRAFT_132295 [Scheffersomyces xylosifermentans]|uniref:uncharacterized protein n=1 Tax=Scheffersomyces xylosifermentans TaxID=1304137 RepID=UPI00315CF3EC